MLLNIHQQGKKLSEFEQIIKEHQKLNLTTQIGKLRVIYVSVNQIFSLEAFVLWYSVKKLFLKKFAKFTGKQLEACNFIKKEALA